MSVRIGPTAAATAAPKKESGWLNTLKAKGQQLANGGLTPGQVTKIQDALKIDGDVTDKVTDENVMAISTKAKLELSKLLNVKDKTIQVAKDQKAYEIIESIATELVSEMHKKNENEMLLALYRDKVVKWIACKKSNTTSCSALRS